MGYLKEKIFQSALVKSGSAYTIATFLLKGISFFTIPLFTRMMTVEQYGVVNNFTAWVTIFSIFVGFNLNAAINNAYHDFREDFRGFVKSILKLSFLIFAGITIITFGSILLLGLPLSVWFAAFVLLQSYVTFIVGYFSTYLMIQNKYVLNILVSFSSTVLNVGISVIFMLTFFSEEPDLGRIVGSTLGMAILAFPIIVYLLLQKSKAGNANTYWKYSLKISVPLLPHAIGGFILSQFDRIMIESYDGSHAVGLYSFVYNVATIISVLWTASNNAWVPWFFEKFNNKLFVEIKKNASYFAVVFSAITVTVMNITIDISRVIGPSDYQTGIALIVPITIGYYFQFLYGFPVNLEFALKKTQFIGISTIFAAGVNVVLNVLLMPMYGYVAAAFTTTFTYFLLFIGHVILSQRLFRQTIFDFRFFTGLILIVLAYGTTLYVFVDAVILRYIMMILIIIVLGIVLRIKIKHNLMETSLDKNDTFSQNR
ncbi:MAG: lipopolysaccharide biosynthesis protein [Weissella confusa]